MPPLNNVKSTTLPYTFHLPDSFGSVSTFMVINTEQEEGTLHPLVFINNDDFTYTYTYVAARNPIGFSKNNVKVYKAVEIETSVGIGYCDTFMMPGGAFCGLKVVDDDNPKSILMLKEQVRRIYDIKETYHDNLLGIISYFVDKQSKKFCVVVNHHIPGSIRVIMKNRFPWGLPGDLILSVLRSILNALKFLHDQRIMHRDINAGHVYLCDQSSFVRDKKYLIKLGFAASVYEEEEDENTPYLPVASMSNWAAAPEVYKDENQPYTEKADIWLVGIMALELAYGGLKVSNRNDLEAMIKEIKLPPKPAKYYVNKFFSFTKHEDYCSPFSESFTDMVMQCLAWNPKKRPSVDKLLSHPFFTNSFTDMVMQCLGLDPFFTKSLNPEEDGQYFYDNALKNKISSSS